MKRPSALVLVAACFLGSGAIRIWDSNAAFAEAVAEFSDAPDASEPAMAASCPPPMEPNSMLLAFREREAQLDAFELQLADREQVLKVAKLKIEDQLAELEQAEQKLAATIAKADGAAEGDIARITTVYENMKPQNAADIFSTMDIEFASNFLIRMRPDAAASILANIEPDRAYSISVMMASRNAGVPKE